MNVIRSIVAGLACLATWAAFAADNLITNGHFFVDGKTSVSPGTGAKELVWRFAAGYKMTDESTDAEKDVVIDLAVKTFCERHQMIAVGTAEVGAGNEA